MADQAAQATDSTKETGPMERTNSKWWQLATILIPILLTGWLTFLSSHSETRIRSDIEEKNQLLSAQLTLTTELFKRRFDTYETLYSQLIDLRDKLIVDRANNTIAGRANAKSTRPLAKSKRQTADLLSQLGRLNEENSLHMSPEVSDLLTDAWMSGVQGDTDGLSKKIAQVEAQMKKELDSQMVNRPMGAGEAPVPASR